MKKIILPFALLFSQLGFSQNLESGLVLYLPFNGNAIDASPNALNATVHKATLTSDIVGKPNSAYYLNGEDAYIDVPDNSKLSPSAFSYSVWFKLEENFFGIYPLLTKGKHNDSINLQNALFLWPNDQGGTDTINQSVKTDGCAHYYKDDNINEINTKFAFEHDVWYHIVSSYSSGMQKIYLNGSLVGQGTDQNSKPALACTSPFTIGATPILISVNDNDDVLNTVYFQGAIDEVRVYNRVITEEEVKKLYALPTGIEKISHLALQDMVYPNPSVDGKFYFSDQLRNIQKVTITDMAGAEILPSYSSLEYIDISQAPSGIYTLRVTTAQGVYVGKIRN